MIEDRRKLTEDLIQIRVMMEPPIAALEARNATRETFLPWKTSFWNWRTAWQGARSILKKDSQFHARIAGYSHNLGMTNLVPAVTAGGRLFAGSVQETEYKKTREVHRRIFEAIRGRRPVDAQQAMYFRLMFNDIRYKDEVK